MRTLLLLLLFSLELSAKVYVSKDQSFSLNYNESDWKEVSVPGAEKGDTSTTLLSLEHKEVDEGYRARFSVVADSLGQKTEKEYYEKANLFLKEKRFFNFSREQIQASGNSFPIYQIQADQTDLGLTLQQRIYIQGKTVYLLTGTARIKNFKKLATEFQNLFESFKLTVKAS